VARWAAAAALVHQLAPGTRRRETALAAVAAATSKEPDPDAQGLVDLGSPPRGGSCVRDGDARAGFDEMQTPREMRDSRFDTVNPDLARYFRMRPRTFSHTNRTEFPRAFSTSCARTCDPV
jgi:hypothetical protein